MDLTRLQEVLKKQPAYRLRQVKKFIFQDLLDDWSEATSLPLTLRSKLKEECPLEIPAETFVSKDGDTIKALITLTDGLKVETVLMRDKKNRRSNTICVSSQVGCPLDCCFCATGKMGFERNLNYLEIIGQVLFFARYLKKLSQKVTNIVFMGMGEPFLNYENVIEAIKIINDKNGFNLGARRISVSTVGIVEGIEKLAEEKLQINLAISLNAPEEALRSKVMPINKKYPIGQILKAVDNYIQKTHRRVMFEYVMMKDLNDSDECAEKLVRLVKKRLCFVNLIPYNPTGKYERSLSNRIRKFKEILEKGGVSVTQRHRFGVDIKAACGQLASGSLLL
jgi:23S rRNA (adenine2503-C2)-methyltransferase